MIHPNAVRASALAALAVASGCSAGGGSGGGGAPGGGAPGGGDTPPADPCAAASIPAGFGCEFWPTVTANAVDGFAEFGVALVNPGASAASIRIEGGALSTPLDLSLAGGSARYVTLPWVAALKACAAEGTQCQAATGTSILAPAGAYHVTSSQPLAVYQFSPTPVAADVGSGDATALPGAHALGKSYVAVAWGAVASGAEVFPGLVAITAIEDGTSIQLSPATAVDAGDVPAMAAGATTTLSLDRGDVLELLSYAGDLTGTRIEAQKPVQVVGGHFCALVPADVSYCDHLEEVLPPVPALGTTHVLVPPFPALQPYGKPMIVRVVGTADGTALAYAPGLAGAPTTLGAGQFADLSVSAPVQITATSPVLVAEYMEGNAAGGSGWGDPSLAVVAPVSRWRPLHVLWFPSISGAQADVIAPISASVSVVGGGSLQLEPIAGTSYGVARRFVGGTTGFVGDAPFTVSAHFAVGASSFWWGPAFAP